MNEAPSSGGSPIAGYVVLAVLCVGGLSGMILGVASRAKAGDSDPPAYTGMPSHDEPPPKPEPKKAEPDPTPVAEGKLEIKDLVVGTGAEAKSGDKVKTHYVGTLTDGKEFDSSKKHGSPFEFDLGKGRVIKGWDEGIAGMRVGGKRKLVIPPHMGYGARGVPGTIPANSTLVFEVELLEVKPSGL